MSATRSDLLADPSEIRARILEDHERLRKGFDRIELLATRLLLKKDPDVEPLRAMGLEMCGAFRRHMTYETDMLRPALLNADSWGEERVAVLEADHDLQLSQVGVVESRLRDRHEDSHLLCMLLLGFLIRLRDDMEDEERMMLSDEGLQGGLAIARDLGPR